MIGGVRFDTPGWQRQESSGDKIIWENPDGDAMSLTQVEIGPSYSFTDVPSVRAMCRHIAEGSRGGLVSAGFVDFGDPRGVSLIYKREQLPAYTYTGMLIIPRGGHLVVVTVSSIERGITGVRDTVVAGRLIERGELDPTKTDANHRVKGWFFDPYDSKYDATALNSLADAELYDSVVPSHPLSKVRGTLHTIEKTLVFRK